MEQKENIKVSKTKLYSNLFLTMMKIGLFTFGGGYAMIALLENEFVSKKKWISDDEFINLIAIAESTPGPIAINASTYIGYKIGKVLGSIISTIAICLPSFAIIYLISLFFEQFLTIELVNAAFKGIQVCVVFLILKAGLNLFKKLDKTIFNYIILFITISLMIIFSIYSINFSSIFFILISGVIGIFFYNYCLIKGKQNKKKERTGE